MQLQKYIISKKIIFSCRLVRHRRNSRIRTRIRVRTKMSQIRNTGKMSPFMRTVVLNVRKKQKTDLGRWVGGTGERRRQPRLARRRLRFHRRRYFGRWRRRRLMARRRRLAAGLQHSGGGGRWRRWGARAWRRRWRGIFSISGRGGVQVKHLQKTGQHSMKRIDTKRRHSWTRNAV